MVLNRKGFTLAELLVTIVIVGLVVSLSVFGIVSLISDSEEQAIILSEDNLKQAARIYSVEVSSDSWKIINNNEVFCVTIGELMNKGFLDKNATIEDEKYDRNSFIAVKRNKVTFVIDSVEIVSNNMGDEYDKMCTG